ncbi:MAG: hypothetical protein IJQ16_07500 [Selenomonadaceae bacterium]|nr:hypothetical protein [Selenomonadaceae bacterium]
MANTGVKRVIDRGVKVLPTGYRQCGANTTASKSLDGKKISNLTLTLKRGKSARAKDKGSIGKSKKLSLQIDS